MQIIFGREVAEQIKQRYTVLELEALEVHDGRKLEAFCVVPADKIPLAELPDLDHYIRLHGEYVYALSKKKYQICTDLHKHLLGKFGGELDSFYEEIQRRINLEQESNVS